MTKHIRPAPKMSYRKRALRLALLPPHEKSRPIYASRLRFSTFHSPTIPSLPPLISPLSLEPPLTPLTLEQSSTEISNLDTTGHESPKLLPPSPRPQFRPKQDRKATAFASVAGVIKYRSPYPSLTKWSCHICGITYAIGVTRRCLRDGHFLCFPLPVDNSQLNCKPSQGQPSVGDARITKVTAEEGLNEKAKAVIAQRQKIKARYRLLAKTNRVSRGCAIKFDYNGWSADGTWKRGGNSGLGMPCGNGCDWPGECRERERRAAKEMRKSQRQEKIIDMVTCIHHFCLVL